MMKMPKDPFLFHQRIGFPGLEKNMQRFGGKVKKSCNTK